MGAWQFDETVSDSDSWAQLGSLLIYLHTMESTFLFQHSLLLSFRLLFQQRGEEDHAENDWMTSSSGVERKFTYSTERPKIKAHGERWCVRHLTPAGAEPTEQWMEGFQQKLHPFQRTLFSSFRLLSITRCSPLKRLNVPVASQSMAGY